MGVHIHRIVGIIMASCESTRALNVRANYGLWWEYCIKAQNVRANNGLWWEYSIKVQKG